MTGGNWTACSPPRQRIMVRPASVGHWPSETRGGCAADSPEDRMPGLTNPIRLVVLAIWAVGLVACGDPDAVVEKRTGASGDRSKRDMATGLGGRNTDTGSLFGPGGLFGSKADKKDSPETGVAVNA